MTKIKFAIFDVGQTIYPYTLEPLNRLMMQLTTDKKAFENAHTVFDYNYNSYMKGEIAHKDFVQDLCKFCHVSYEEVLVPLVDAALREGRGAIFPETFQAMQLFKSHGIAIGILSNALPILGDAKMELVKREYIFTSYELGLLKPDIKIYQTLAQKLNVPYEQILFIDDKERNILPAQSLGINGIIFNQLTLLKDIETYLS